jgi:hypothetical protein
LPDPFIDDRPVPTFDDCGLIESPIQSTMLPEGGGTGYGV